MSPTKKTRKVNNQRRWRVTTHHIALVLALAIQAQDVQIPGLGRNFIGQSPLLLPLLHLSLLRTLFVLVCYSR